MVQTWSVTTPNGYCIQSKHDIDYFDKEFWHPLRFGIPKSGLGVGKHGFKPGFRGFGHIKNHYSCKDNKFTKELGMTWIHGARVYRYASNQINYDQ